MILIFDTETTGLTLHPAAPLDKQPRMIEFAAVLLNAKGMEVEQASFLVNPQMRVEPIITTITGLTNDDLAGQPTFGMVLPRLRTLFAKASYMVAHNLPFDKAIVSHELSRLEVTEFPWPIGVCTVGLYLEQFGYRPKLKELYERVIGAPLEQTHRALDDVQALVAIIQKEKLWKLLK